MTKAEKEARRELFKQLVKSLGMNFVEIAQILQMSPHTLTDYNSGRHAPNNKMLTVLWALKSPFVKRAFRKSKIGVELVLREFDKK